LNSATATVQTDKPQTAGFSTTLANLTSVISGELLLRIANFAAAIVIARRGGLVTFGFYAAALAYSTIATMLADNGLQVATVRDIARTPSQADSILSRAYASKLFLSVPMVAALAGIGYFSHLSAEAWYIAALVTFRTVLQSFCQLQLAALKGLGRKKLDTSRRCTREFLGSAWQHVKEAKRL
jgi:O-antigen/teichoic acid export membrane protein